MSKLTTITTTTTNIQSQEQCFQSDSVTKFDKKQQTNTQTSIETNYKQKNGNSAFEKC